MNLVQRKFYFPKEMYSELSLTAKLQDKTISTLLRELVESGLARIHRKKQQSKRSTLTQIAKLSEQHSWYGPEDLAAQHDTYTTQAKQTKDQ